jgi:D-sedoheptulose 7-phosphate isomerase|tara:strand:+ start:1702 stop:2277 length:576 start_codon:yes stop_codon:yes gene_type:complete
MKIKTKFEKNLESHINLLNDDKDYIKEKIEQFATQIIKVILKGGKILVIGNGGSAADAQHFATELTVKMLKERKPLPVIALTTDTSALTAIGNDFGFEHIFSRQVEALMKKKDLLISISTSGNSKNIINALKFAKSKKFKILNILGNKGGSAKNYSKKNFIVNSNNSSRVQEVHLIFYQNVCEIVENYFLK